MNLAHDGVRLPGAAIRDAVAVTASPFSRPTASRMLTAMRIASGAGSPMAMAALALMRTRATAMELRTRFKAAGVAVRTSEVAGYLGELEALGLVRLARSSPAVEYVATDLGKRLLDNRGPGFMVADAGEAVLVGGLERR